MVDSQKKKGLAIAVVLIMAALGIAVVLFSSDRSTSLLQPRNSYIVAQGAEIYAASCASCHGANLGGEVDWQTRGQDGKMPAPPHDDSGHTWHHTDQLLFDLTKKGISDLLDQDYRTNMPAYEGVLTDQEIVAVLSFIKSRWPQRIQDRHDQMNENTREK